MIEDYNKKESVCVRLMSKQLKEARNIYLANRDKYTSFSDYVRASLARQNRMHKNKNNTFK
jgi:hypothetical protein